MLAMQPLTKPARRLPPRRIRRTPVGYPPPFMDDWTPDEKVLGALRAYGALSVANLMRLVPLSHRQITALLTLLVGKGAVRARNSGRQTSGGQHIVVYEVA
jgi:hypothetical protein